MASKLKDIQNLLQETILELNDYDNFISFLKSSAWTYKYPFKDQVLIYAQKPEATAVASYEMWNNKFHRYINAGTKGIAFLRRNDKNNTLKYVFDISDTNNYRTKNKVTLWQYESNMHERVYQRLADFFDVEIREKEHIVIALDKIVGEKFEDIKDEILEEISELKIKSGLKNFADEEIEDITKDIVQNAAICTILARLGYAPDEFFDKDDFLFLSNFDNSDVINILGESIHTISSSILREIESEVKKITRERKEKEIEENEERDNLQESRGYSNTGAISEREWGNGDNRELWGVRSSKGEVPAREQTDPLQQADNKWRIDESFGGGGSPSNRDDVSYDRSSEERQELAGQGNRSDRLVEGDEYEEADGRRSSSEGADLHLNQTESELDEAINLINEFYVEEYNYTLSEEDYKNLEKIPLAYTTITDNEIPIQAYADLINFKIKKEIFTDDQLINEVKTYDSLRELIDKELRYLSFDELTLVDADLDEIELEEDKSATSYYSKENPKILITDEILEGTPKLYETEKVNLADKVVHAAYIIPLRSNWTWYMTEYDSETGDAFGLVTGFYPEWGYFNVHDLEKLNAERLILEDFPKTFRELKDTELRKKLDEVDLFTCFNGELSSEKQSQRNERITYSPSYGLSPDFAEEVGAAMEEYEVPMDEAVSRIATSKLEIALQETSISINDFTDEQLEQIMSAITEYDFFDVEIREIADPKLPTWKMEQIKWLIDAWNHVDAGVTSEKIKYLKDLDIDLAKFNILKSYLIKDEVSVSQLEAIEDAESNINSINMQEFIESLDALAYEKQEAEKLFEKEEEFPNHSNVNILVINESMCLEDNCNPVTKVIKFPENFFVEDVDCSNGFFFMNKDEIQKNENGELEVTLDFEDGIINLYFEGKSPEQVEVNKLIKAFSNREKDDEKEVFTKTAQYFSDDFQL